MWQMLKDIWPLVRELGPKVWSTLREVFLARWSDPLKRWALTGDIIKTILIAILGGLLYYSVQGNVELVAQNQVLSERIELMLDEKLKLEGTCAVNAPKQQEYKALEDRLRAVNSELFDVKEQLELCTTDKVDSVNRRLRELTRK